MSMSSSRLCDSRFLQLPQPTRPLHSYNMNSECRTPTPKARLPHQFRHSELLQFPRPSTPIRRGGSFESRTPKDRFPHQFLDSELLHFPQVSTPTRTHGTMSFESHVPAEEQLSHPFFHQYCNIGDVTAPLTTDAAAGGEGEELDEEVLRIIESRLEELKVEASELLVKFFSKLEKEIPLEKCLKGRLQDPRVRGVSELFERLEENLQGQGNFRGMNDGNTMQRSLSNISTRNQGGLGNSGPVEDLSQKLERFKIRTLSIRGVIVKDEKNVER
ncbi:hypothetical protein L1049_007577 [Liquidambar formosana]|uniref:Uncharacterized protein n=1 Tax=Liquidambar formosana TaxID=63359 RepID=A0AAP0S2V4_LIQFO